MSRADNPGSAVRPQGNKVLLVSSNEKVGLSGESAFENPVVFLLGCDDLDALSGSDEARHGTDGTDSIFSIFLSEVELLPEDTIQFGKNEWGDEKLYFPSTDTLEDLVWLATRKGKGRDQDVGVEDNPHGVGGSLANCVNEPVNILLRLNSKGLRLHGRLPLEFPPAPLLNVHTQGLTD